MMASPTPSAGAMSLTSNSSAEEDPINTKCRLCSNTYTIPKVLHCFHSFCYPCLEKIYDGTDRITCPECSKETYLGNSGLNGLLSDYAVGNVLEANVADGISVPCTSCKVEANISVSRCYDCAHLLCSNCTLAHQFMHCFEGHRVCSLQDLKELKLKAATRERHLACNKHKQQGMTRYCLICNVATCPECSFYEHGEGHHEVINLSEVSAKEARLLRQLSEQAKAKVVDLKGMARSLEHSSNRLHMQHQKSEREINETYNFYRTMLEDRKQDSMKELDSAFNTKMAELSLVSKRTMAAIDTMSDACEFVDKITKYTSPNESIIFKKMIEAKMHDSINYVPDISICNGQDLEFVSNYQAIQVGIRNTFGYIRQGQEQNNTTVQPIARPTSGLASSFGTSILTNTPPFSNGLGTFEDNLGLSNQSQFSSSSNLSLHTAISEPLLNQNMYERWSNGGTGDIFQNSDIFSTPSADPVVDLTSRLITANVYPPKSQLKRNKMIYNCKFGEFGVAEGQFTEPSGVAVNAQNDIIVADTNNHRIQIFDKEGRYKFHFGECGKRDGQLLYPNRVAVIKASGDIVVTERSPTHQVQIFNQYGQFIRKFGANILQHPRGVTVDNKGRIIIVECKVMRVIIFDQLGNIIQKFGCSKHLEFPNGVVVNDHEEIMISDNRAHCVKVFSYQGVFFRQIGGEGITNYPIGVGINRAGEVLVADNHNNFNLTMFDQDGTVITALESKVKHAQCFDVALMDDGSIVLASKDYRLYIYRYVQLPAVTAQ